MCCRLWEPVTLRRRLRSEVPTIAMGCRGGRFGVALRRIRRVSVSPDRLTYALGHERLRTIETPSDPGNPEKQKPRRVPDFDWADYRKVVDAWFATRDVTARDERPSERQRFARASVVLFGWLPLAIVMFWLSLILTKGIAFVNDDPTPRYGLSVSGVTNKAALASLEGEPSSLSLEIAVPFGTRFISIQRVSSGLACAWDQGQPVSGQDGIEYVNPRGRLSENDVRVTVPTSASAFGVKIFYGSYSKVLTVRCKVAWQPKQESFSKYDIEITNALANDADRQTYEAAGDREQNLVVSAYKLNESKLLTLAGRRTAQDDERDLIPGASAIVDWNSENGEEERDALFVVIGAFIAIGAAILIEGLRPHVELAIESNYAGASGTVD